MKGKKFAKGNPQTGLAGSGDTSSGLSKRAGFSGYMPRGETQGQRPGSAPGGGGSGNTGAFGKKPRGEGTGQRPAKSPDC